MTQQDVAGRSGRPSRGQGRLQREARCWEENQCTRREALCPHLCAPPGPVVGFLQSLLGHEAWQGPRGSGLRGPHLQSLGPQGTPTFACAFFFIKFALSFWKPVKLFILISMDFLSHQDLGHVKGMPLYAAFPISSLSREQRRVDLGEKREVD